MAASIAASALAAPAPTLRVARDRPLVLNGANFKAHESVRVTGPVHARLRRAPTRDDAAASRSSFDFCSTALRIVAQWARTGRHCLLGGHAIGVGDVQRAGQRLRRFLAKSRWYLGRGSCGRRARAGCGACLERRDLRLQPGPVVVGLVDVPGGRVRSRVLHGRSRVVLTGGEVAQKVGPTERPLAGVEVVVPLASGPSRRPAPQRRPPEIIASGACLGGAAFVAPACGPHRAATRGGLCRRRRAP
jgi:hypothetical protein